MITQIPILISPKRRIDYPWNFMKNNLSLRNLEDLRKIGQEKSIAEEIRMQQMDVWLHDLPTL